DRCDQRPRRPGGQDRQVRGRVARPAEPGRVQGAPRGGYRARLHRRVHRHQDRGRLLLPRVRHGALPQRDEVRLALRLAVLLRAGGGPRPLHRGHHPGDEAGRGALHRLRLPPGARVRRRLRHPDRAALLHQLDQHAADPGREL
ncbi:MAG: Peptide-methionine (R)-S-oxide reductase MsrB, partial [uncultured Friedmanniella sp.]